MTKLGTDLLKEKVCSLRPVTDMYDDDASQRIRHEGYRSAIEDVLALLAAQPAPAASEQSDKLRELVIKWREAVTIYEKQSGIESRDCDHMQAAKSNGTGFAYGVCADELEAEAAQRAPGREAIIRLAEALMWHDVPHDCASYPERLDCKRIVQLRRLAAGGMKAAGREANGPRVYEKYGSWKRRAIVAEKQLAALTAVAAKEPAGRK
jgi:hypothetical protein